MRRARHLAVLAALTLPLLLSGCALLFTKRKLPIPQAPSTVLTATPQQLVDRLDERWDKLQTLNATVEIQTSVLNSKQGIAKDYTTFPAIILIRKPRFLRVYARVPVVGTTLFDLASNGEDFTLYIPSKNMAFEGSDTVTEDKAVEGSDTAKKETKNTFQNIRPGFFFNAMFVRGLEPDDVYSVTADTETIEDPTKKHLLLIPEYILSIMRPRPGSRELTPIRVITLRRSDLLPAEQDLYDSKGTLETQVSYRDYLDFGFGMYPSTIIIQRPQEGSRIHMTVEKVTENMTLDNDQFVVKIPQGTTIQNLH